MSCWALWQRLPRRYHLTNKDVYGESDPTSQYQKNPVNCEPQAPRHLGQAIMYFNVSSHRDLHACFERAQSAFPSRSSPFLNSSKQQHRINSARQNLHYLISASQTSPSLRARTAPAGQGRKNVRHKQQAKEQTKNHFRSRKECWCRSQWPTVRLPSKSAEHKPRNSECASFDDTQMCDKHVLDHNSGVQQDTPGQTDNPAEHNDKNVIVKNCSNNDTEMSFCQDESCGHLARLRKFYLQTPKDLAKVVKQVEPEQQERKKVLKDRLEYEKRTDRILNYYTRVDDVDNVWTASVLSSRHDSMPVLTRAVNSQDSKRTSVKARSLSGKLLHEDEISRSARPGTKDVLEDWNAFLKMNSRSALHERLFDVGKSRNPAKVEDTEDSGCCLCRLEMEVAMLRQRQEDRMEQFSSLAISVPKSLGNDTL